MKGNGLSNVFFTFITCSFQSKVVGFLRYFVKKRQFWASFLLIFRARIHLHKNRHFGPNFWTPFIRSKIGQVLTKLVQNAGKTAIVYTIQYTSPQNSQTKNWCRKRAGPKHAANFHVFFDPLCILPAFKKCLFPPAANVRSASRWSPKFCRMDVAKCLPVTWRVLDVAIQLVKGHTTRSFTRSGPSSQAALCFLQTSGLSVFEFIPWARKTMKKKGFGHPKTRLFTKKTSKHVGFGGPWYLQNAANFSYGLFLTWQAGGLCPCNLCSLIRMEGR